MKKRRYFSIIVLIIAILSLLTACKSEKKPEETPTDSKGASEADSKVGADKDANTDEEAKEKTVGFILLYRRDEWYKEVERVAIETAKERNLDLEIYDSDYNSTTQIQQVESLTTRKVDAIALAPCDPSGPLGSIKEAADKDIPVFAFDTGLDDYSDIISYIAFDNYKAGYEIGLLAADFLNTNSGGAGKVGIIFNPQNALVHGERVRGFKQAISEKAPSAEIVAEQDGKDDRATSMAIMENILTNNSDIAVMFGGNPDTQYGIIAALEAKGVDPAQVFVGGEGWGDETLKWMAGDKPYMKACFVTPPDLQASSAVNTVADYLEGKSVESQTFIDADIVTTDNAKEYFSKYGISLD